MVGGVVAVLLLSTMAHAEVLCVRFKKDGTLTGAIKVRNECKRREVQVDGPMLGLCCDGSTTTTTSTTTTIDTGFTTLTTTAPTFTTSTTFPAGTTTTFLAGTTTTSVPGTFTTTFTIVTTTVTSTVVTSSTIATTTSTSSSSTSTSSSTSSSTVTTTSLNCPTITTSTIIVNNCGGNPPFCNGFCADGSTCYAAGGIECSCGGPPAPCGQRPNGTCGGTCAGIQVCGQTVTLGPDGCPQSYGCGCMNP